jgi:hypothetical protein
MLITQELPCNGTLSSAQSTGTGHRWTLHVKLPLQAENLTNVDRQTPFQKTEEEKTCIKQRVNI